MIFAKRFGAILAFLVFAAGSAKAETCTTDASGTWTAIATGTVSWTGCTATDDDDFVISDTFTVTIPSGSTVTQDGLEAGTGVTVESGGEFIMQAGATIVLNINGLDCEAGSTCTIAGAYRQVGIAAPGTESSPSVTTRWYAGDLDLCPGADCKLASLSYAAATYEITTGPGITFLEAAIDAIDATDILCWWSLPDVNKRPAIDEGFCYEISASETVDPYSITFEVRQGTKDQDGFPLTRRDILQTTLTSAATKGDRILTIEIGDFPSDDFYNGRMIRFEDGSGNPESISYRIMDSEENVGNEDTIEIADAHGIMADQASGDDVWIDYGWQRGDSFLVVRPARITSATAAEEDSDITFSGNTSVSATVFDGVGGIVFSSTASVSKFEGVWVQDATDTSSATISLNQLSEITIDRFTATGGSTVGGDDKMHTFVPNAVSGKLNMNMIAIRHAGDDHLSVVTGRTAAITIDRFRCQFRSTNGASQGCLQGEVSGTFGSYPFNATNIEVLDAIDGNTALSNHVSVINFLMIANNQAIRQPGVGTSGPAINSYIVGNTPVTIGAAMFPIRGTNFVSRNNKNLTSNSNFQRSVANLDAKNGLIIGNTIGLSGFDSSFGTLENIAFINNITTSASAASIIQVSEHINGVAETFIIKNILMVDEPNEFRRGIRGIAGITDAGPISIEGVAFYDFNQGSSEAFLDSTAGKLVIKRASKLCFFSNVSDMNADTNLPADSVRGIPPNFVSPESNRFDVRPGSAWHDQECGVKFNPPVGVCRMNRTLAWSNLEPECMTDFNLGPDGLSRSFSPERFGG